MIKTCLQDIKPMMITSLIAGFVLTILGPYGTADFPLKWRLLYWTGLCMAGGLGAAAFDGVNKKFDGFKTAWLVALVQSFGATLFVTICLFAFTLWRYGMPNLSAFAILPFFVWVVSIVICGISALIASKRENLIDTPNRPVLVERLKPSLRQSEIYALKSEDHYVRVMTSKGDDLLLTRLSDAMKEIEPLPGLSPHRSWWIAEAGVKSVKNSKGKLSIVLHNYKTAPVSRNSNKTVRAAGWI